MKALLSTAGALCLFLAESRPVAAQDWFITPAPNIYCLRVACSADGLTLAAVGYTGMEVSTNRGEDWMMNTVGPDQYSTGWTGVASSANGETLVAVSGGSGGAVYVSQDAGVTWQKPPAAFHHDWSCVACSPDGTRIVTAANYDNAIYTSTDSGLTWVTNRANEFNNSVAMSADGTRMVVASWLDDAGGHFYGRIQYSVDSGASWHLSDAPTNWHYAAVACSTNGNFAVAVCNNVTNWNYPGPIYVSTNSGVGWQPTSAPLLAWTCVTCSADGSKVTAGAVGDGGSNPNGVYSSTNHGATWFANDTILTNSIVLGLNGVASSADGNWLVGGSGPIFINPPPIGVVSRPPNLSIVFVQPASVVVSWPAIGSYTLQQNSHLSPTNWTTTGYSIITANDTNSITITPPKGNLFFRLSNP